MHGQVGPRARLAGKAADIKRTRGLNIEHGSTRGGRGGQSGGWYCRGVVYDYV